MTSPRKSALEGALGNLTAEKPKTTEKPKRQAATLATKQPKQAPKRGRQRRQGIVETTLYLPEDAMWQLKELAMLERCRQHDIVVAALDLYFSGKGRPTVTELRKRMEGEKEGE